MENKLTQEEVWDRIAPLWNRDKKNPFGDDDKGNFFINFINKSDKRLLDVGCGSGRNFISVKEAGFKGELYGVDFSKEMLRFAEENAKELGLDFIAEKSKVSKLSFKDDFFDKIICIATIHCLETNEERKKAIKEMYRVLKKGGKLLITSWNKTSKRWKNKPKDKFVGWKINDIESVQRYYYLFDSEELVKLLEEAGFKIIKKNREDARNIIIFAEKS